MAKLKQCATVKMRQLLIIVDAFRTSGIEFVPVLKLTQRQALETLIFERLNEIQRIESAA